MAKKESGIRTILITLHSKLCVFIKGFLYFSFLMEFCYESFDVSGECMAKPESWEKSVEWIGNSPVTS